MKKSNHRGELSEAGNPVFDPAASEVFAKELLALLPRVEISMNLLLDAVDIQGAHAASPENVSFLQLSEIVHLHTVVGSTLSCAHCRATYGIGQSESETPVTVPFRRATYDLTRFIYRLLEKLGGKDDAPIWVPDRFADGLKAISGPLPEMEMLNVIGGKQFFKTLRDNYLNSLLMEMACRLSFRYQDVPEFNPETFGLPCVHECFDVGPFRDMDDKKVAKEMLKQFDLAQQIFRSFLDGIEEGAEDWQQLIGTARTLH